MNKKPISHKVQKALLEDIVGNKIQYLNNHNVESRNLKTVFCSKELFRLDIDESNKLENKMNEKFESDVLNIFRKVKNSNTLEVTYAENIKIRGYIYLTFLRLNNIHMNFDDQIIRLMNLEYKERFEYKDGDPLMNFFINQTHMKIIKHDDYPFLIEQNFILTYPFDTIHTDIFKIQKIVKTFPGFVFPISKNHSIVLTNNALLNEILLDMKSKTSSFRFNFSAEASKIFIMPQGDRILENGKAENLLSFLIYSNDEELKSNINESIEKIKGFDETKTKYRYKITKLKKDDFNILIIDNISKYFGIYPYDEKTSIIFKDKNELLSLINAILDIEYEVESSKNNLDYWRRKENIFKHKVWEILNDKAMRSIILIKKDLS